MIPLRLFLSILICHDFRRPRLSAGLVGHCSMIMDSSKFTSPGMDEVLHCFGEPVFVEVGLLFSRTVLGFSFILSRSSSDTCTYHSVSMVTHKKFTDSTSKYTALHSTYTTVLTGTRPQRRHKIVITQSGD